MGQPALRRIPQHSLGLDLAAVRRGALTANVNEHIIAKALIDNRSRQASRGGCGACPNGLAGKWGKMGQPDLRDF